MAFDARSRFPSIQALRHRPGSLVVACPQPWHGLGNRMRSLLGSRVLARQFRREFAYTWPVGRRFGARLDQLWNVDDRLLPGWWSRVMALRHPYRDGTLEWLPGAGDDQIWQIRTAHALSLPPGADSWEDELRGLVPVEQVAARIEAIRAAELGSVPYVGVMIRTHAVAHTQTLAASPLEWYTRRLREIRLAYPSIPFFISADTDESLREVKRQIPNCVGLANKGTYNSLRALQSSLVDLYLLASSVHIIGAHYSSFPELARSLGGDEIALETSRTDPAEAFEQRTILSQPPRPTRPHIRAAVSLTA